MTPTEQRVIDAALARQASVPGPGKGGPQDEIGNWPEDAEFAAAVLALRTERDPKVGCLYCHQVGGHSEFCEGFEINDPARVTGNTRSSST